MVEHLAYCGGPVQSHAICQVCLSMFEAIDSDLTSQWQSVLSFPSQWLDLLERGLWWKEIQGKPLFQSDLGAFTEKYFF